MGVLGLVVLLLVVRPLVRRIITPDERSLGGIAVRRRPRGPAAGDAATAIAGEGVDPGPRPPSRARRPR